MAATVSELQVVVSADTSKAESGLSSFSSKLGSVGGAMATAFGAAAIGGVLAVGAGLASATGSAAGFEKQMSAIKAVSGSTAAEMEQLSGLALKLGADTSFSASEAAQGIEELIKAGVSVADVMGGGASAALSLAAAGAVSVKDAAELTSNALNAFGLAGKDAAHVADVIAGAANSSAIDVGEFKFSLSAVGAVAHAVGMTFDDTATAIAVMGQAGIKGSDAGTSLKTMLLNLQPTTKAQISLFRELGIVTADGSNRFFDAKGNAKSFGEIAEILKTSLGGLTKQQQLMALETMFGSDAIRAGAVFLDQGAEGFNKMAESMSKVTAEAVAQERLNNLSGVWEQLTGSLETAGITLGMKLLPPLTDLLKWGTEALNGLIPTLGAVGEQIGSAMSDGITKARDLFRQLSDAWGTVKQVFGEGWAPDASIEPLALAAGNAALALKDLAEWGGKVADAAGRMGVWDQFEGVLSTIEHTAGQVAGQFSALGDSLNRFNAVMGGAGTSASTYASALDLIGRAAEVSVLGISTVIDTMLTMVRVGVDVAAGLLAVGRGFYALATGDIATFLKAGDLAEASFKSAGAAIMDWADNNVTRAQQGYRAIAGAAETEMPTMAAAVETGMSEASQAASAGYLEMASAADADLGLMATTAVSRFAELSAAAGVGTAEAVAAVDTGMAAVGPAVDTGMAAAVAGVQAGGEQMAAAAGQGAAGAVAAVEGQTGAASAAGASVGDNLGSGMQSGILGWVGRVAAAARQLVSSALAAGNAEGEIESPSKKTMYMGQMLDEGLIKGIEGSAPGVKSAMQALIKDVTDYGPAAAQIAQVEKRIKEIREEATTAALFRAQEMITIDSEALRLRREMVNAEKDLVGPRQDIARVSREIADIERGMLGERVHAIELSGRQAENNVKVNELERERIPLRARELEIERLLLGMDPSSKRAEALKKEQDEIRKKNGLIDNTISQIRLTTRAHELEVASNKETQTIASISARIRQEELKDQAAGQELNISLIKDQLEVLGAEQAAFQANENVIKNATQNEIDYRNRLIAVFTAEAKPLTDRIAAGLALVDQLEKEGKISKELADRLRDVGKESGVGTSGTKDLGNAAAIAAPQMDAAAKKAEEMAKQAQAIAKAAHDAEKDVLGLAKSLGKLPSWFTPTGGGGKNSGSSVLFGPRGGDSAGGSTDSASILPMLSPAGGGGGTQTHIFKVAGPDGRTLAEWHVRGREVAVDLGLMPRGSS